MQSPVCSGSEKVAVWRQIWRHTTLDTSYQTRHRNVKSADRTATGGTLLCVCKGLIFSEGINCPNLGHDSNIKTTVWGPMMSANVSNIIFLIYTFHCPAIYRFRAMIIVWRKDGRLSKPLYAVLWTTIIYSHMSSSCSFLSLLLRPSRTQFLLLIGFVLFFLLHIVLVLS